MPGDVGVDEAVAAGDDAQGQHVSEHDHQHHVCPTPGLLGQVVERTTIAKEEDEEEEGRKEGRDGLEKRRKVRVIKHY